MSRDGAEFEDVDRVFERILEDVHRTRSVSDAHLASLCVLFGRQVSKAVAILDRGRVLRQVGRRSGREACLVCARPGKDPHLVLPGSFCSCQAFEFEVFSKGAAHNAASGPAGGSSRFCKHLLAASLALALGAAEVEEVTDEAVALALALPLEAV